jgi:hypothetical protein
VPIRIRPADTDVFVISVLALCLSVFVYFILGALYGTVAVFFMVYESLTLISRYPNATISESIWRLSARPIVPFIFGISCGVGLATKVLKDPYLIASIFFLMGHFFFQAQTNVDKANAADKAIAVDNAKGNGNDSYTVSS